MGYPMVEILAGSLIATPQGLLNPASPDAANYFTNCDEPVFYEVIRLIDGEPLFWDDHCLRLQKSIAGRFPIDPNRLLKESHDLIRALGPEFNFTNLRLVLQDGDYVIHLSPAYYPTAEQFTAGVAVNLLHRERKTPNIKMIDPEYKMAVADGFAAQSPNHQPFELLLVNQAGQITEGSRSNVFFIQGNAVLTAPDELILCGITRRHVFAAIVAAGAAIQFQLLTVDQIESGAVDGAFLTGSPIDILPITMIGNTRLQSAGHPLILAINEAYQTIVRSNLAAQIAKTTNI
jgi:branched-chain amino acid aminotransferase